MRNRQYFFRTETRGDEERGLLENPENPGFSWAGLITLVDFDRMWLLSNHGLGDVREMPRDNSFCTYAIATGGGECFVVPDALEDARFNKHPLVTGWPHIRFYAGVPLMIGDGSGFPRAIGTLCLMDVLSRAAVGSLSRVWKVRRAI